MATLNDLANVLLDRLFWTSLQAILLVFLVVVVQALLPRLRADARCALWWLVGLQAVVGICWHSPLHIPLSVASSSSAFALHTTEPVSTSIASAVTSPGALAIMGMPSLHMTICDWLIAVWVLGILAQLPPIFFARRRLKILLHDARPVSEQAIHLQCEKQARQLGLHRCPRMLESPAIATPTVGGFWHPFILLPEDRAWTPDETRYVIAHELAHLKRRDLWLGSIPILAQRLFFFHPIVRLALREYATYREAACDAEVLRQQSVHPKDYGQLLLRLGVVHSKVPSLASASPTFRNLRKRLLLLRQGHASPSRISAVCIWALIGLVAVLGVLPYRVVAAPRSESLQEAAQPHSTAAEPIDSSTSSALTVCCGHFEIYAGPGEGQALVLFDNGNVLINGGSADIAAAKPFYSSKATLLWFRRDGNAYLVRDKAVVRQVKNLYAPVLTIVREQTALLGKQERLSSQMALITEKEMKLAHNQLAFASKRLQVGVSDEQSTANSIENNGHNAEQSSHEMVQEEKMENQRKLLTQKQLKLAGRQDALDSQLKSLAMRLQRPVRKLLDKIIKKGDAKKIVAP
ncbi:MAG: M56 family metallopeptidase [Rhodanobacteraceae bacterium]